MRCLNCGAEIKGNLEICPYCKQNFKLQKKQIGKTEKQNGIFILFVFICFAACFSLLNFTTNNDTNNKPIVQTESNVYAQNISKAGIIIMDQAVQKEIQKRFSEGLEFYSFAYSGTCVDPMKVGLFTYKNKFEGKVSKKEHSYSFRVGANKLINNGIPKLYYLSVDGETWYFDEDGEDKFISASDKALKKALQQK